MTKDSKDQLSSINGKVDAATFAAVSWNSGDSLLPLSLPAPPRKPSSRSGRLRQSHRQKRQVWRIAVGMINLSNSLFNGDLGAHNRKPSIPPSDQCKAARQLAVEATLREASAFARDRRRFFLTGGHRRPMETLIKGLAVVGRRLYALGGFIAALVDAT